MKFPAFIKLPFKRSVARNIVILLFVFGIVPLGILTSIAFYFYYTGQIENAGQVQKEIAERVSLGISAYLERTTGQITTFTLLLIDESGQGVSAGDLAYRLLDLGPEYDLVILADLEGNEICKVSRHYTFRPFEMENIADQEDFKSAKNGRTTIGAVTVSNFTHLPQIPITVPIVDEKDEVTGILKVGVNMIKAWQLISPGNIGKGRYAYIVDPDGTLIAFQEVSSVLRKKDLKEIKGVRNFMDSKIGVFEYEGLSGKRVIGAGHVVPLTGWAVFVEQPIDQAYGRLYFLSGAFLIISLLTIGLALFSGLGFSFKRIVQPIERLQDEARIIAKGELDRRIGLDRDDELGELADSFNMMVKDLKKITVSRDLLAREIKARTKTEKALKESEERFRTIFEGAPIGMARLNAKGRIGMANPALEQMFGYGPGELNNKTVKEITHPEDFEIDNNLFRGLVAGRYNNYQVEKRYFNRDGRVIWGRLSISLLDDTEGQMQFCGMVEDITERKMTEEALRESLSLLKATLESTEDGILVVNLNWEVVTYNQRFIEIWGIPEEMLSEENNMIDLGLISRQLKHPQRFVSRMRYVLSKPEDESFEMFEFKDGRICERYSQPQRLGEKIIGRFWSFRDVTERVRAEESLRAALLEKEVLLKEVHHRVKNNMQVIISLLNLQAGKIDNEQTLVVFQESQDRIRAMALIHETLYSSGDMGSIDLKQYVTNLTNGLFQTYDAAGRGISVRLEAKDVIVAPEQAVPCGLVINELISNALKYAFPGGEPGEISIVGRNLDNGACELIIADNGVGMPEDLDWRRMETLGLSIVASLVEGQLKGTLDINTEGGTRFTMRFGKTRQSKTDFAS